MDPAAMSRCSVVLDMPSSLGGRIGRAVWVKELDAAETIEKTVEETVKVGEGPNLFADFP